MSAIERIELHSDHTEDPGIAPPKVFFGEPIVLRDGVSLSAIVYMPAQKSGKWPGIMSFTPYVAQSLHDTGLYFANAGFCFVAVDVRGRGNSGGEFWPFRGEGTDGFDAIQWLSEQEYCSGQVAMWGGSYAGFAQWAAASKGPPALRTIAPVASPCIGIDNPMRNNIAFPYLIQWLTMIAGRALQDKIFHSTAFWAQTFAEWYESGAPFIELDLCVGKPSAIFREWMNHPEQGEYWDRYNPSAVEYSRLSIPVLTITGIYDSDQPGALEHYRRHLANASDAARANHYLVIGPWDHAGTRIPQRSFGGVLIDTAGVIDLRKLHLEWYRWHLQGGPQPAFLRDRVTYYVMGEERWRHAETLDAVTACHERLYLRSGGTAGGVFAAGKLSRTTSDGPPDSYAYDPSEVDWARIEGARAAPLSCRPTFPQDDLTDQSVVVTREGKQLVYHGDVFASDIIVAGFFRLDAWIGIDQPDTDIGVAVYEIDSSGKSLLLSCDSMRARYRTSLHEACLITDNQPLLYSFKSFTFVARLIRRGHRLRLTVGPLSSIHYQKNHNSGGCVAHETSADSRVVRVNLFHDAAHGSILHVPIGLSL